jgi:TonB-linked SusC/RagA family outer membrane protein
MQDFVACKVPFFGGTEPKLFLLKRETRKIVLVMKITAVLLLAAILQVSAKGWGQEKISLTFNNAPLEQVLNSIHSQANVEFIYRTDYVKDKKVTVNVSNASLKTVLDLCLHNQQLTYDIFGKNVSIHPEKREEGKPATNGVQFNSRPPGEIRGHVANDKGEPLAGANITVRRTGKGTITDANGNFKLADVTGDDIIIISYVGYQAQSMKIGDKAFISLALGEANNELDQVVMQAYGTTTRRFATGNIAKVTSKEIEDQPVSNVLQALQGKVPGLVVTQTNGFASAPFKVELRGRNSMGLTNQTFPSDPLYIIDGVPLTVLDIGGFSNYNRSAGFIQNSNLLGPAGGQSPLFSLNTWDIESIEVLKDADATAIYGSRGANGVILITTKKGKAGKTNFDINISQGVSKVARFWNMMNTQQYLEMRREAFKNDNVIPTAGNAPDLLVWDTTSYTNWQKKIWGGLANNTNVQLSLTGGNDKSNFRLGAGYLRSNNVLAINGSDQKSSLSFNFNHHPANKAFSFSYSSNYSFTKSDMISIPSNVVALAPDAPSIFDSAGSLNYSAWGPIRSRFQFASLMQPYTSLTYFLNNNLSLNYEVLKGLILRMSAGVNYASTNQKKFTPISSLDPINPNTGTSEFGHNFNKGFIVEPQIEYNRFISKGKLNILIGSSYQYTNTEGIYNIGTGYTSDLLLKSLTNAPNIFATENYGEYKYLAAFGRINYIWKDRYIVNLTGRRDGSSRFGEGKQFGNFGSIAAAWIFSGEKFFKLLSRWVNYGKLRGSYGTTGSDAIGDYQYLTRWSSTLLSTYSGYPSMLPIQHANPDFQWQINKKLEAALDLSLFNNRLSFSIVYYQNKCGNQLVNEILPIYTGFSTVAGNWPAVVQNKGWEFSLNANVVKQRNFSWDLSFNIGINRNKLLAFPNIDQTPYARNFIVGDPLNISRYLHFTGVDPQTGLYTFEDKNKDGNIINVASSPLNDLYAIDKSPKYSGGFGSSVKFKGLSIGLWFNYIKQLGLNAFNSISSPGTFRSGIANMPTSVLSRWRKTGDQTNVAKFTVLTNNQSYTNFYSYSDGILTDASFIRLSNVSISYSLPEKYLGHIRMKGCKAFINAQNLFTFTNYNGIDPETQSFSSLPTLRTIVGGISLTF